jgi:hypothetical protein
MHQQKVAIDNFFFDGIYTSGNCLSKIASALIYTLPKLLTSNDKLAILTISNVNTKIQINK